MADTGSAPTEEEFLLAGEHALGVLEGADREHARRLMLDNRHFADAVEWWQMRLGSMAEATGTVAPSTRVWPAIEARLAALPDPGPIAHTHSARSGARRAPSGGSIAALVASAVLACVALALFLATPSQGPQTEPQTSPPGTPEIAGRESPSPPSQLVAQIGETDGARSLAALVDRGARRIALRTDELLADSGRTPELWVIPEGADPVSLGAIPQDGPFERALSIAETRLLSDGASLAVTFEEDDGKRHTRPSPPIVLAGALQEI